MTALTMMVQADQEKGGRQTGLNCLVNFPSNLSDMMISGYLMYTTHFMYLCAVLAISFRQKSEIDFSGICDITITSCR